MQLRQGKIIQKQKMQELSSLFMTHRINVMHALVKETFALINKRYDNKT